MKVSYRPIQGFPRYRVGDDGTVWSLNNSRANVRPETDGAWRRLYGGTDRYGYKKCILMRPDRTRRHAHVHTLILEAFVGPRPDGNGAAHNNGKRDDNRLENLRWDTHKNNIADKIRHGTAQVGEKHPQACLTDNLVRCIREERARTGHGARRIARRLSISVSATSKVIIGKTWLHIK